MRLWDSAALVSYLGGLVIPSGDCAGQAMTVLKWEQRLIRGACGCSGDVALSISRGAGKSGIVAGIAAAAVDPDGPLNFGRADVVVVASAYEQSKIIFDDVVHYLREQHDLDDRRTWRLAETSARDEMSTKVTRLLPVPKTPKQVKALADELVKGGFIVTDSASAGTAHIAGAEPSARWAAQLIHPDPTQGHVSIRSEAAQDVLSACGIPPALVNPQSDGTSQRESFRRWLHSSVQPLAWLAQDELRLKLDAPELTLSFDRLFAADLSGRARGFQSMVGGGMDVSKAAALSGLMESEGE